VSRITRTALSLALLSVALSACGDSGVTEVTFALVASPEDLAGYQAVVAAFEEQTPDVRVTLAQVADEEELFAKLTTAAAGGDPVDVALLNYRAYGQFAAAGALAPVGPLLDSSAAISPDEFAPIALDAFRDSDGVVTCMPQNVSSLVVYYNADLFAAAGLDPPAPGWSWDDFLATAHALTGGDAYGLGVEPRLIRVAPFVWSNGGEIIDDDTDPTRSTLDVGPARDALDWFLDLQSVERVVPNDAEASSEDIESRFLNGRLGMLLESRRVVPTLRTITGFEWDVAPLPVAPGGEPATILHSDAYCLSARSPDNAPAWRFIEFATGVAGQTILTESGRIVPSRLDVAGSPTFLDASAAPASNQVFIDVQPSIRLVPRTVTWAEVESSANSALEDLFYGRVDREAGIAALVAESERLLSGRE